MPLQTTTQRCEPPPTWNERGSSLHHSKCRLSLAVFKQRANRRPCALPGDARVPAPETPVCPPRRHPCDRFGSSSCRAAPYLQARHRRPGGRSWWKPSHCSQVASISHLQVESVPTERAQQSNRRVGGHGAVEAPPHWSSSMGALRSKFPPGRGDI